MSRNLDVAGPVMHAGILGRDVAEVASKLQREGYANMRPMSSYELQASRQVPVLYIYIYHLYMTLTLALTPYP